MATIDNNKYLSLAGLQAFWTSVKQYIAANVKVSVNDNASNYVNVTADEAGRVITVEDAALVTKIAAMDAIDAGLRTEIDNEISRADAAEKKIAEDLAKEIADRDQADKDLKAAILGDAADDYNTLGKLEDKVLDIAADLEAAIGQGGNVASQITAAINDLDVTDTAVDGQYVSAVSEADGKISVSRTVLPTYNVSATGAFVTVTPTDLDNKGKAFEISTSNIASASDLTDLTGRVKANEDAISALSSATHFIGVVEALPETAEAGDIVIMGNKEYIYDATKGWVELGDTTAELAAIDANTKAIAKEIADREQAIADEVTARNEAIAAAVNADKLGMTNNSAMIDVTVAEDGKSLTFGDKQKLTDAVALAETSVQDVAGSDTTYIQVSVTGDANKTVAATAIVGDVTAGENKLTTAEKVKAYVDAKAKAELDALVHNNAADDDTIVKVVTNLSNREDGTGFDVDYTNFEAINNDEIAALFANN